MPTTVRVAPDERQATRQALVEALQTHDAIVTSGGAWKGDRDLVAALLDELRWQKFYHRIRLGPGKALGFGLWQGKPVFILPGGPPSNQTAFLQLALPGLHRLAGRSQLGLPLRQARLAKATSGQRGWTQFVEGRSGTGKTTFLEELLPELKKWGLRVGILKHHAHATGFDVPGKDTYRLAAAGAAIVVGASPVQTAVFIQENASKNAADVIRRHLSDMDLVLTEGYMRGEFAKVELHRAGHAAADEAGEYGLLCDPASLLAVVTDEPLSLPESVPQFDREDVGGVARLLLQALRRSEQ
ncbi:MAG TPA: molybdopterin-guanine dinucleotide biosynthesis protein B [Candidatus Sulfomarinibacteraceae bacterium]|nr:molybdopterin-guanine dinucleotide biosynthesis protein B [Candidatus Sulfomarinibacteraceae bacterium]